MNFDHVLSITKFLDTAIYPLAAIALMEVVFKILRDRKNVAKFQDSLGNFALMIGGNIIDIFFTKTFLIMVLFPVYMLVPWKWEVTTGTFLLTLLLADFTYYWTHRTSHRVRFFWSYHSVHHSSNEFNLSTAIRLPWFDQVFDSIFYFPLVILGAHPVVIAASKGLVLLYQYWVHTESIKNLGAFDKVFNSPSNHRVHHASNERYIDKNHGGILIIWDRLFGTYQQERDDVKPIYGLVQPFTSQNPFVIAFYTVAQYAREFYYATGAKNKLYTLIAPPEWSPEPVPQKVTTGSEQRLKVYSN